jgi:hypothetical protein
MTREGQQRERAMREREREGVLVVHFEDTGITSPTVVGSGRLEDGAGLAELDLGMVVEEVLVVEMDMELGGTELCECGVGLQLGESA